MQCFTNVHPRIFLQMKSLKKTGKALYDEKTKLWCTGPAYIAELYMEELKKS